MLTCKDAAEAKAAKGLKPDSTESNVHWVRVSTIVCTPLKNQP
jgi:hypothetical protein